ncbi:MAG: sigma-70 family RNA polymerase sigma factor [Bacteroidota bacterium]
MRPLTDPDRELVEEIRGGKPRRFGALVDRHKERAMTLALRMLGRRGEAEEAVQDAFLRAYRNLDTFRGESRFATWFYRILYNSCLSLAARRGEPPPVEETGDIASEEPSPLDRLLRSESEDLLARAVALLPPPYRDAVTLHYVQELSCAEAGEVLGVSEEAVKVRLFRARSLLRNMVAACRAQAEAR